METATVRERDFPFSLTRSTDPNAEDDGLTFEGYAAVFNSPTRIEDHLGTYDETIAPGAFKQTINRGHPVLMFNHGKHPLLGMMPLGKITELREDARGLFVRARLSDNWLVAPVRDAIRDGAIDGMSFRFETVKDTWQTRAKGEVRLRTLREVKVPELGPVVFPAYSDTSAAVRSTLTALTGVVDGVTIAVQIVGEPEETDTERDGGGGDISTQDPTVQDLVEDAIEQLWGIGDLSDVYPIDVYADRIVFTVVGQDMNAHPGLWQVSYSYNDGAVSLGGDPAPVKAVEYAPRDLDTVETGEERDEPTEDTVPANADDRSESTVSETETETPGPSTEAATSSSNEAAVASPEERPSMTTQAARFTFLRELELKRRGIKTRKD